MKLFTGGIVTETNTFSPIPSGASSFEILRAADLATDEPIRGFGSLFQLMRQASTERGWEFEFGLFAYAQPAGPTVRAVYESMRDELATSLKAAMPVDAVLLFLHGAMVAQGHGDCESDILAHVREIVGPGVKIGVELDLHCSLTQETLDLADAIVLFKEYPHTDMAERAFDLFRIVSTAAEGQIRPTMALHDCRMIGIYPTTREPMRSFVDGLTALEGKEGVLSLSLAHSFPWGDVEPCSVQTLAITDGDPAQAARLAEQLGRQFHALRHELHIESLSLEEALDKALAAQRGPVVIADQADNAGGGAPSDSTFALRALLERSAENVALGMIWDPIAVQMAILAGVGATVELRLGGKMGPASGDPLDLLVTVTAIERDMIQQWPQSGGQVVDIPCGDSVALHCQGIDIVANSIRSQVISPQVFARLGIDPETRRLLVVKSTQHFYAEFEPFASEIIYMAAPGAVAPMITEIPYQRVDLNKYPWVDEAFAE